MFSISGTVQFTKIFTFILTIIFLFSSTVGPTLAAVTYLYDANGNMTSNGTDCYEYNEANKMIAVKDCSSNQLVAEYVYDHDGQRTVKKIYSGGVLQKTVYSISDEYEVTKLASNSAEQITKYYKANDEVVAKRNPDGTKEYIHNDHLGSASVITNQSGEIVEETTYQPFGEIKSGGTTSKFAYTGQEHDSETSLNYYDARYYDPHTRRFIQPDTLLPDIYDPQQLNRYSYVSNNPLKYTDPTGNWQWLVKILSNPGASWQAATKTLSSVLSWAKNIIKNPQNNQKIVKAEEKIIKPQNQPPKTDPKVNDLLQQKNNFTNFTKDTPQVPKVADPKLQNLINNNLYKGATNPNRIGNGSTADAIRNEALTGQKTFGKWHDTQGKENINALNNWLKTHPNASEEDIKVANTIKIDIINALQGK